MLGLWRHYVTGLDVGWALPYASGIFSSICLACCSITLSALSVTCVWITESPSCYLLSSLLQSPAPDELKRQPLAGDLAGGSVM